MIDPWIRLKSGRKFHILRPSSREIHLDDIVHNLSHICRFTGAVSCFYSVLQHSCHVHDIAAEDCKREALCHDFSEAFLSDLSTQLKSVLPQYRELEERVEKVIARKFRLTYPYPAGVKVADMTMLVTEMRSLMPCDDYRNLPFPPLPRKIVPWTPEKARREFLRRFRALKNRA